MDLCGHVVGDLVEPDAIGHQRVGESRGESQLLHHLIPVVAERAIAESL
jgi:hypothetical protein